ncbi:MAG TPA: hypothetical protein VH476_10025 [Solirubrobacterales bacterium]
MVAVNIPGMAPYAVTMAGLKAPRGRVDLAGAGLPALVSTTDPTDIEILWDEVPSLESQVAQRMDDAMQGQRALLSQAHQMQEQMMEAAKNAGANPAGAGGAPAGPAAEMMVENAKRALAYVTDPAMREMLIKQYHAAGIRIDDDEST